MSAFSDSEAHAGCVCDVALAEQNLVHTCSELDSKKADKEFVVSAVNAVSVYTTACTESCLIITR